MFCRHKYGKIEDGYQYCEKCGRAISAPARVCSHEWVAHDRTKNMSPWGDGACSDIITTLQCKLCGTMKNHSVSK